MILLLLITATIKLLPTKALERSRDRAKELWSGGKPKKWYYAVVGK